MTNFRNLLPALLSVGLGLPFSAAAADLSTAISQLHAVSNAEQAKTAQTAWRLLAAAEIDQLTTILAGMNGASPLAENWLRSACDAVVERNLESGKSMPVDQLRDFVLDSSQSPRARRSAYEWLVAAEPAAPDQLLPQLLNDPSLELRYDAVEHLLKQVDDATEKEQKLALLERALDTSRDLGQIDKIAKQLTELDRPTDLTKHLGFITDWHTIGPFDIAEGKGFSEAYPPEISIDFNAKYPGPAGELAWTKATAEGERGELDFMGDLGKEATGVIYAAATFSSPAERTAEIRYESNNGTKVWLNGNQVATNEVYHSGSAADQYIVPINLQPGENSILIKICQTKRKEDWAKEWSFRLRISDSLGGAIHQ